MKKKKIDELPNALEKPEKIIQQLGSKKPSLFLDYDGTLTPIVNDPDEAVLSDENREILVELSDLIPVTLISGRDLRDLRSKVNLDTVTYAGSHGFDIKGPDCEMEHESEKEITPALDEAERNLNDRLKDIEGVKVERKKYAIAVHYRRAPDDQVETVKTTVDQELARQEKLKKGTGKKIVELKPDLDWHKGKALNWLTSKLDLDNDRYLPLFIGDDITDEDAFEAVRETGIGIVVGSHGEDTAASFRLRDTDEVTEFLRQLKTRLE